MAVISIFANGIALDFVKETLTIKKENNAFSTNFKVSYSTYPFLVIENQKTRSAMGPRDKTSVQKKLVIDVVVLEMGQRYTGRLQVVNYLNGYRKCNLMYGSDALQVLDKKLSDLLPVISINPAVATPPPFLETAQEPLPDHTLWRTYPLAFAGKIYPEVNFGFPQMAWADKYFEEAPEEDDVWYRYTKVVNRYVPSPGPFEDTYFVPNTYAISGEAIEISNANVAMPQLFLLGMLKMAFATIGYTIAGSFVESPFARRLQVLSTKDNMCAVQVGPSPVVFTKNDFPYSYSFIYRVYKLSFTPEATGEYTFTYTAVEPLRSGGLTSYPTTMMHYGTGNPGLPGNQTTLMYANYNDPEKLSFTGSFTISVGEEEVGQNYGIFWQIHTDVEQIQPITLSVTRIRDSKTFQMMHPTIPLGRYAPDMTLSTYINEVKNLFCLDVQFDDHARVVNLNFAQNLLQSAAKVVTAKSLAIKEEAPADFEAFILKYANAIDNALYIEKAGVTVNKTSDSDLVEKIESRFKTVPYNGLTANLSKISEKEGTGLMIYDPIAPVEDEFVIPYISPDYNGQTLEINGTLGIYNQYWRAVMQLRLNGSVLEMQGPFTEQELIFLDRLQKIHIQHQEYIITSLSYSKTRQGNYDVKFNLLTVTL